MCLGRTYFRFNTFNTFWIAWPKFARCGSRRLQKLMPKQTERDFGPTAACRMPAPLMWHINCPPQFSSPPHTTHPTPSSLNDCRSATRYLFDLWNFLAKEFFNKTNFIGIILQLLPLLCAREEINNATRLIKARIHRHAPSYERVCVCVWGRYIDDMTHLGHSSFSVSPASFAVRFKSKSSRVALLLFAWPDCSSWSYLICHYPELCWHPKFSLTLRTDFVILFSFNNGAAAGHSSSGQQEIKSVGKYYSWHTWLCPDLQWIS